MILDASGREVRRAVGFMREREVVVDPDDTLGDAVASQTIEVPKTWTVHGPHAQKGMP